MNSYTFPGLEKKRPYGSGLTFTPKALRITEMVCNYFGYTVEKIQKLDRKRELVTARQYIFFLLRKYTGQSLDSIGKFFGGRDHTTVKYNIDTLENLMENYPDMKRLLIVFENKLAE